MIQILELVDADFKINIFKKIEENKRSLTFENKIFKKRGGERQNFIRNLEFIKREFNKFLNWEIQNWIKESTKQIQQQNRHSR